MLFEVDKDLQQRAFIFSRGHIHYQLYSLEGYG